jgi:hypothetical protein
MKDETWIEAMDEARCVDCRFFDVQHANEEREMGVCRRFPPVRPFDHEMSSGSFAEVAGHDWCGEFELTPSARRAFEAELFERWNGRLAK